MPTASPVRSVASLDAAMAWTRERLEHCRTTSLSAPTPCADWDLGQLLGHMEDSLTALGQAAAAGHVGLDPPADVVSADVLVDRIVQCACRTREAWQHRVTSAPVGVGDLALGRDTVAWVGALEIAVHGWDVAVAAGHPSPLPEDLAVRLHDVALAVVLPQERGRRFGPPVEVPASASASARLLAHLGRTQH